MNSILSFSSFSSYLLCVADHNIRSRSSILYKLPGCVVFVRKKQMCGWQYFMFKLPPCWKVGLYTLTKKRQANLTRCCFDNILWWPVCDKIYTLKQYSRAHSTLCIYALLCLYEFTYATLLLPLDAGGELEIGRIHTVLYNI